MFKHSLALRIFVINFLLLVIPMFIWLGFFFNKNRNENVVSTLYHLRDLAYSRSTMLGEHISFCDNMISILVDQFQLDHPDKIDPDTLNLELKKITLTAPSFGVTYSKKTVDDHFVVEASSFIEKIGQDVTHYLFISSAVDSSVSMVLGFGPLGHTWVFVTKKIVDENKAITGMLTLSAPPDALLSKMINTEYSVPGITFSLATTSGLVFANNLPSFTLHTIYPLSQETLNTLSLKPGLDAHSIPYEPITPMNIPPFQDIFKTSNPEEISLFWPIENSNSVFIVGVSEDWLLSPFYEHLWKSILLVAFASLLSSLFIWLLVQRLSKPLAQLTALMRRVGSGALEARFVPDDVGYEINLVGDAVNRMLNNLLSKMESVQEEQLKQEIAAKELKIGHQIQQQILPQQLPVVEPFLLAATAKPALEVGGDFYDAFTQAGKDGKEKMLIAIADTSGKGISACLYSLVLRSIIRSYAAYSQDVGMIIKDANNLFCTDTELSSMFVTVFIGLFDPETRRLDYYSAGHLPALLKRKNGQVEKLWTPGTAIGIMPIESIQGQSTQLEPGDQLLLYTDGVTEAMDPSGQLFGDERLMNFMKTTTLEAPQMVLDSLIEEVEKFENGATQHDDITAVLVRCK